MRHPDGLPAQFGDAGLRMSYAPDAILTAAGPLAPSHDAVPTALPDAGYWTFRSGRDAVIFDAGPICAPSLPAHGHGDALSFEWSVGGRRIIVDQGVFEYVAGTARHDSRTAHHHNTVSIAAMDQADFFGAFRIGARARVRHRIVRHDETTLDIEGTHDGFVRTGGPIHRRWFRAEADGIRIEDALVGASDAPTAGVASRLLLHPDVVVTRVSSREMLLSSGPVRIVLASEYPAELVDAIWWPDMGQERSTRRLVMSLPHSARTAWLDCRVLAR